jgi:hypothetical protein
MQNRAPPPARAQEHGNVLFAGLNPAPNTYTDTVDQAGGFVSLRKCFRKNASVCPQGQGGLGAQPTNLLRCAPHLQ